MPGNRRVFVEIPPFRRFSVKSLKLVLTSFASLVRDLVGKAHAASALHNPVQIEAAPVEMAVVGSLFSVLFLKRAVEHHVRVLFPKRCLHEKTGELFGCTNSSLAGGPQTVKVRSYCFQTNCSFCAIIPIL